MKSRISAPVEFSPSQFPIHRTKATCCGEGSSQGTMNRSESLCCPGYWAIPGKCDRAFPGGVTTGPGNTFFEETVNCDFIPDSWTWSVTIPGPQTIDWVVNNSPVGVTVCAQIFNPDTRTDIFAQLDVGSDWLLVVDSQGSVLYNGLYREFDAAGQGFVMTELRRCAIVDIPVPVFETTWGQIKSLYD